MTEEKKGKRYILIPPVVACIIMMSILVWVIQPHDNNIEVVVEKNAVVVDFGEGVVSPPKLSPGDFFVVSLKLNQAEPVKGFESKVSFNPLVLNVENVSRGSLFENYKDFFSPGIIDNKNGTIVNIFNLIVGPGPLNMTKAPGSLVKITFKAIAPGISKINLYDTRITNSTGYLPVTLTNNSVVVYEN